MLAHGIFLFFSIHKHRTSRIPCIEFLSSILREPLKLISVFCFFFFLYATHQTFHNPDDVQSTSAISMLAKIYTGCQRLCFVGVVWSARHDFFRGPAATKRPDPYTLQDHQLVKSCDLGSLHFSSLNLTEGIIS